MLGVDGIADFNALHSRRQDEDVQLYAFDILALDGEELRSLPLSMHKTNRVSSWGQYSTVEYRVQHAGAALRATLL